MKTRKPSQNQPTRARRPSPTAVAMKRIADQQAAAAAGRSSALGTLERIGLTVALTAALVGTHLAPHLMR